MKTPLKKDDPQPNNISTAGHLFFTAYQRIRVQLPLLYILCFWAGSANIIMRVEISITIPRAASTGTALKIRFSLNTEKSVIPAWFAPNAIRYTIPNTPLITLTANAPHASFLFFLILLISQLFLNSFASFPFMPQLYPMHFITSIDAAYTSLTKM